MHIFNHHLYMVSLVTAFAVSNANSQTKSTEATYSLKTIESNPIPRKEHLALWKKVALNACADSKKRFNLSQAQCFSIISKRSDECIAEYENRGSSTVHTLAESRSIGRNLLYCATPYYFCGGVEVKTEAEVIAKCS
jgi:hypothetical protein